ncbi:MAG: fructose-bisphosphate aldolase [Patescibacteria group bacterium]
MSSLLQKVRGSLKKGRTHRFDVKHPDFSVAKRRNFKRIMLPSGRFFILPIDQGLEHGPSDFLENPACGDPEYQLRLAKEVGFSAIAMQIGLARKYWQMPEYKKSVPLVLKINGKTCIPNDSGPFSPADATVEEAAALGAMAIGYTLYVGSSDQDDDFIQFRQIRQAAFRFDLPVIVWAYPRGKEIDEYGGKNSLAAIDYAVRVAMELGADVVKFNLPVFPKDGYQKDSCFEKYNELKGLSEAEMLQKVINTAGKLGTLLSGGDQVSETTALHHASLAVKCGIDGVIFGRNVWQREYKAAVDFSLKIKKILLK